MTGGPFIRVDNVLINLGEVGAVQRSRHDPTWSLVTLLSGRTVDVHLEAGQLIERIGALLRQDGSR
jgi:hypothetical protein